MQNGRSGVENDIRELAKRLAHKVSFRETETSVIGEKKFYTCGYIEERLVEFYKEVVCEGLQKAAKIVMARGDVVRGSVDPELTSRAIQVEAERIKG